MKKIIHHFAVILFLAATDADTIIDFSGEIPAKNSLIENDFPGRVPNGPGIDGATVSGGHGTPDIEVSWSASKPGAWQFYRDEVWDGVGQLDGGGTSNKGKEFNVIFTPDQGIAVKLNGFHFQSSEEGSSYNFDWSVIRAHDQSKQAGGSTGLFRGTAKIPVKIDFTGETSVAYTLKLIQTAGDGPGGNIAIDDLSYAQLPTSAAAAVFPKKPEPLARFSTDPLQLRVMQWNILHGGRDDGKKEGPARVVEVIRAAKPDIVAMQETYGSGAFISKELCFLFHPRGTNVSIHSRWPIVEDISVYKEFCCAGAIIELADHSKIAFYSIWLGYSKEIWEVGTREGLSKEQIIAACKASEMDIAGILSGIKDRLKDPKYKNIPIIIAGDFNSMSHLDYTMAAKKQFGFSIDWPTSLAITADGFTDSYRQLHPEVNRGKDSTWSPRFPLQQQDRIDFIYYKGGHLKALASRIEQSHPIKFPSDHAALITDFSIK